MGMYDDIENVEVRQRGQYFQPGIYELRIKALKAFEGQKGETFVAEFEVLTATKTVQGIEPNAVGTGASWVRTFEDKSKTRLSQAAIMELLLALLGKDPGSEADQDALRPHLKATLKRGTGEENCFEDYRVNVEAFHTKTKAGGTFTIMRWAPAPEAGEADGAEG